MGFFDNLFKKGGPLDFASSATEEGRGGEVSFFSLLLKVFAAILKEAFAPEPNAPDFEDGTPAEKAEARRRYETTRRQEEERSNPSYKESARSNLTDLNVGTYAERLTKMRAEAEQANGGKPLQAVMPVGSDGRITDGFGARTAPTKGASTQHKGLDIASMTPGAKPAIISAMPGIVAAAGWREGYGNTVEIVDIYGERHRYGHLDSIKVKAGEQVKQGEMIGVMGTTGRSTGVHLHYEQRATNGEARDPVLMGRNKWDDGQKFTFAQTERMVAAQNQAKTPADVQLASLKLAGMVVDDSTYVSPARSGEGSKPDDKGQKR